MLLRALCRQLVVVAGCCGLSLLLVGVVHAQAKPPATAEKPMPPPEPEDITIATVSGDFDLKCTWYPSSKGKDAVPVILIHPWGSRRTELEFLAKKLQEEGHAVLVPDLRGHGESNKRKIAGQAGLTEVKPADLGDGDLAMMATIDFVAMKNELITRHNAGEINVSLLTLVGIEFGANLALNWTALDYSQPDTTERTFGHDIQAMILISPESVRRKLMITKALTHPAVQRMSLMLISGKDAKMEKEMQRIRNSVAKFHPEPKKLASETDEEFEKRKVKLTDFYERKKETTLQGLDLTKAENIKPTLVTSDVVAFIKLRLVNRLKDKDLPQWEGNRRKDPTR